MFSEQAANILRRAETEIAQLATHAAAERDYDGAGRLLGIARNLAVAAEGLAGQSPRGKAADDSINTPSSADPILADGGDPPDDEPSFERDGENLIKRGKSRSDAKGYEHKAPRAVVHVLIRSIEDSANKKGEFRTSRIFPLRDAGGTVIPIYQGYLMLRWLRQIGLVERLGRQRYRLDPARDSVSSLEQAWQSLPQR